MQQHVKAVAILSIFFGALWIFAGLIVFAVITGVAGSITAHAGEMEAAWITGIVGTILGSICVIIGLPSLIGGIGLLKFRWWARILILIVAALSLPAFPVGTAYGIYAFWALLHNDTKTLFT